MKAVIFASMVIFFASSAKAGGFEIVSPFTKVPASANLVETFIDPVLLDMEIIGGRLDVDLSKRVLRLSLQPTMPYCPKGMACIQLMPQAEVFELPIVSMRRSTCGDRITAKLDNRPADGALETIRIIDYTFALCKIGYGLPIKGVFETVQPNSIYDGETLRTRSAFSSDGWY